MCVKTNSNLSRRNFLMATASSAILSLANTKCFGAQPKKGCWLRAATSASGLGKFLTSSGDPAIDKFCQGERKWLNPLFQVNPALRFFKGAESYNAFATPEIVDPSHPAGTVLVGVDLARELTEKYKNISNLPFAAVLAHEWGHIHQYVRSFHADWDVEYELRADAGAGWYLLQTRKIALLKKHVEPLGDFFSTLGNREFNNFRYHGTPTQRKNELLDAAGLLDSIVVPSERKRTKITDVLNTGDR